MARILVLLFIIALSENLQAQNTRTIAFYNVENLFDTIDGTNDDAEYLPNSKNEWNSVKYFEKLDHLNKVFACCQSLSNHSRWPFNRQSYSLIVLDFVVLIT